MVEVAITAFVTLFVVLDPLGNPLAVAVPLYDDGTHGDGTAGDGTWANQFVQTSVPGVYKFLFQSIGLTSEATNLTEDDIYIVIDEEMAIADDTDALVEIGGVPRDVLHDVEGLRGWLLERDVPADDDRCVRLVFPN